MNRVWKPTPTALPKHCPIFRPPPIAHTVCIPNGPGTRPASQRGCIGPRHRQPERIIQGRLD